MATVALDRNSELPLYLQLRQTMIEEFASQQIAIGTRLPTERELQERFQVSRATVRSALDLLEQQGYIKRVQGAGTILARPKIEPDISRLTSFTEDLQAKGLVPGSETLEVSLVAPPAEVAESFGLDNLEKVWFVHRLRLANGEPIGIHNLYIPPSLEFAPQTLQTMESYYALLKDRHAIEPFRAIERFTAKIASQKEASLLKTSEGAALLAIQRLTFAADERVVEFVEVLYRADRYEYKIELSRQR